MFLEKILARKREEYSECFTPEYIELINNKTRNLKKNHNFLYAIGDKSYISIIAEIKHASPSKGILRHDFDPEIVAGQYNIPEISAISVLTDKTFFKCDKSYISIASQKTGKPVLRKDFLTQEPQIPESIYLGADAVLLIAAVLDTDKLSAMIKLCDEYGLDALVEVHNKEEVSKALEAGAKMIGINNRDLRSFQVSLDTTLRLSEYIPSGVPLVSESGIFSHDDVRILRGSGINAILAGEVFMTASSVTEKARELRYGRKS